MRWLLVVPLGLLFLWIAYAAHAYVAQRMLADAGLEGIGYDAGIALIAIGFVLFLLQPVAERALAPRLARFICWPATIWMGMLFWLLLTLWAADAIVWLFAIEGAGPLRALVVGGLVTTATVAGMVDVWRGPYDVRVEIELDRWPQALDGYRIAQISDIHIGALLDHRFARRLTDRVNALDADLVAVTGDLVDGPLHHLSDEVQPFADLRGQDGVFFVVGNHDFYSGIEPWAALARDLGMRVLRNERMVLRPERFESAASFVLAGVDDHRQRRMPGHGGEDLDEALAGIEDDPTAEPVVLLAHDPSTFKRAHAMGIDLQISGHTHGGQMWPFHFFVRAAMPFVAGRYRRGDAELYVSRGSGFWGPPMRLFAPAEITEIVLRAAR